MIDVADCLIQTHDLNLVLLAGVVCLASSLTAFHLFTHIIADRERSTANLWLFLTATVAGSGVWATHFIGMLAFQPLLPIAFELSTTVLSLVMAVAITAAAFSLLLASAAPTCQFAAGVLLGVATVAMHYTGIAGLRVTGSIVWNYGLIGLSALLSIGFATPALLVAVNGRRTTHRTLGAMLFALSIVSLHFTGMSAITILPDPAIQLPGNLLFGDRLGYSIAAVTLLIVGCAFAAWTIDRRSRREHERRFRFMAGHDALTSLPNRVLFEEVVQRELARSETNRSSVALLCIDLDGFKEVNDLFGHPAGDRTLVEVALRLHGLLGERCIAARLGGDEFAVLATGLGQYKSPGMAAQSILNALAMPFDLEGSRVDIGCSIGISLFPENGGNYAQLLSKADTALVRAKTEGKGIFRCFQPAMDEAIRERRHIAHELKPAIGTDQLRLVYQPQTALATDRVCGFEVLLRWHHPVRGLISPDVFIPIAEETGLILPIGEWVLREACREAASWKVPLVIAVNLSIAQFKQTGLPELVRSVLAETRLPANRLELEVTESLFLDSNPRSLQALNQIKALGVRIAMDDFGTGYSSLSTLQSFPFDKIKVDRSFTQQIGINKKGTAIVKAILGLGDSLELPIIAEGVETEEQLSYLKEQHCAEIQGFLRGRPRPISDYAALTDGSTLPETVIQLRRA